MSEAAGHLNVVIFNKKKAALSFGVKTIEDTAFIGKDFKFLDDIIELTPDQPEYKL